MCVKDLTIALVANGISDAVRSIKRKLKIGTVPQILSRTPPSADATSVIGRDEDLKKLWKVLSEKKHVLLKGFGGIGKTRLAQMLFHKYKDRFDEVAWIRYQGDLKKSFFDSIDPKQVIVDGKNDEERWNAMVCALNNAGKKKLFIIDNVDSMGEQHPQTDSTLQELTGWVKTTVLLTSRVERLEAYETYDLDYLSKEECSALFRYYYQGGDADPATINNLVELAGRHTLTIELLAKGARQEEALGDYYQKIKQSFEKADEKFGTSHHHNEEDTMVNHLRYLYNMQSRNPNEVRVLQALAILPVNSECSRKELEEWFGLNINDWTALMNDGWLQYDNNRHRYSLHPLVRTIVRLDFEEDGNGEKNICPGDVAGKLLDFLAKDDQWHDINKAKEGHITLRRMMGVAESAMGAVVPEESDRLGTIDNRLSRLFEKLGDYNKALKYGQNALVIEKIVHNDDHKDTAMSYNAIGNAYLGLGEYEKSLEYHENALAIRKKVLCEEHCDTAASYNNIGIVYEKLGDYKKALKYHEKSLAIEKILHGEEHNDTATSYDNIGNVYSCLGDNKKALEYYEKALAICKKVLGEEHADTATSYNNIGTAYSGLGDYKKALEYYEKALAICKKVLGDEHSDTAGSYNNIGIMYSLKNEYPKALEYLEKALKIREAKLGENHPLTQSTKRVIGWTKAAMDNGK